MTNYRLEIGVAGVQAGPLLLQAGGIELVVACVGERGPFRHMCLRCRLVFLKGRGGAGKELVLQLFMEHRMVRSA